MKTTGVRFAAVLAFALGAVLSASALTGFDTDYDAARERAKATGDLYYFQLWNADGETLEHDFRPAMRDSDNVVGKLLNV